MKLFFIVILLGIIGCSSNSASVAKQNNSGIWNDASSSGSVRQWTCIESLTFKNISCN